MLRMSTPPITFTDGRYTLVLSFGYSTSPGDTARQQNWRAWVACEGVDLAGVVEEVTFTVQTECAHAVKAPPYQLVRTSTVQGNHNQELQVVVAVHFKPWLRQAQPFTHELLVVLRGGRNRQHGLSQGPHTDDRMVVLQDPEAPRGRSGTVRGGGGGGLNSKDWEF